MIYKAISVRNSLKCTLPSRCKWIQRERAGKVWHEYSKRAQAVAPSTRLSKKKEDNLGKEELLGDLGFYFPRSLFFLLLSSSHFQSSSCFIRYFFQIKTGKKRGKKKTRAFCKIQNNLILSRVFLK